jgi:hypothetical protein
MNLGRCPRLKLNVAPLALTRLASDTDALQRPRSFMANAQVAAIDSESFRELTAMAEPALGA